MQWEGTVLVGQDIPEEGCQDSSHSGVALLHLQETAVSPGTTPTKHLGSVLLLLGHEFRLSPIRQKPLTQFLSSPPPRVRRPPPHSWLIVSDKWESVQPHLPLHSSLSRGHSWQPTRLPPLFTPTNWLLLLHSSPMPLPPTPLPLSLGYSHN